MRIPLKIIIAIACVAAVPSVAIAATASGSGKPFAINCFKEQFKPKRITIACGDAGIYLSKLKWTSWSRSSAKATGTYNQNDCTPDCAGGKIRSYPVQVTLSKPKSCRGQAQLAFKRATLTYTGTQPSGAPAKLTFPCPAVPSEL
jgi:hypothetical protein